MLSLLKRPRRNRKTAAIRSLVRETTLTAEDLVAPFFIQEGEGKRDAIATLPGVYRLSLDELLKEVTQLHLAGIQAVAIFPVIDSSLKDPEGSLAFDANGLVLRAVRLLKKELPDLCLITDIALDPYTSHGHDGVLDAYFNVANDPTVDRLVEMALLHAEAGVDLVAPSDMMDGRVFAIRKGLDKSGFSDVGILSYAAKYASSLYGPFRDALGSSLQYGDKKRYQMDPANVREALLEARLDEEEGADLLMVKPALFYLDVIARLHAQTHLPIAAYHVSGEYAMVMAAEQLGMLRARDVFYEALLSVKRAGASVIFSYATPLLVLGSDCLRRDPLLTKR